MVEAMTADDVFPLVAGLRPVERVRLLRLLTQHPGGDDAAVYAAVPPKHDEFSSDEESLAWEMDGWEELD